jgi:hypothetical protein
LPVSEKRNDHTCFSNAIGEIILLRIAFGCAYSRRGIL